MARSVSAPKGKGDHMTAYLEFKRKLEALDLGSVIYKLTTCREGPGWSLQLALASEAWYRRMHFLFFKYPDLMIVPSKLVDEVWHHHVLDTQKYYEDCMALHGRVVHHFPYLGSNGPEDALELDRLFQETNLKFVEEFGSSPESIGQSISCVPELLDGASVCGGCCSGNLRPRPGLRVVQTGYRH